MGGAFRVAVVLSAHAWSRRLHAYAADHLPDVELVMVRDRQAALAAEAQVLLVDESTPWLNQSFVDQAERAAVRLVGVYDRLDGGAGRARLAELGLTYLLEEAMPAEDVMFLLERLRPSVDELFADGNASVPSAGTDGQGRVVGVGGPSGSGAREFAVAGGAGSGPAGRRTLLVDANETTPGISRRLGVGVYPHVVTAVERLRLEGLAGVEAALADRIGGIPFDVLVGLPTVRDWDRLVAEDIDRLLDACRRGWQQIVVTTSPLIEDLQRWGDRFGVSRRVLSVADAVVGCCEPSPRGVLRYLDWLVDASQLQPTVVTVLNKVPRSRRVAAEAARQLADVAGDLIGELFEVPVDRAVTFAEWDGDLVRGSRYRRAADAVAAEPDRRDSPRSVGVTS